MRNIILVNLQKVCTPALLKINKNSKVLRTVYVCALRSRESPGASGGRRGGESRTVWLLAVRSPSQSAASMGT